MRKKVVLKNTIYSLISYFVILVIGFITQRIFKDSLGQEYLGLHGLFTNIMTMLSIVELGFGTAIISNMYSPVANNDIPQIKSLLQFYKKTYRVLTFLILGIGMLILPFLQLIVGETSFEVSLVTVFLFYLADTVSSYFMTYKRSIIYAYQKSYYTSFIHAIAVVIMNLLQIYILISIGNYYFYLAIRIIFRLIENVAINMLADKKFPFIREKDVQSLEQSMKTDIVTKVKGLFFHKIGTFLVAGSDNIIITMLPGMGLFYAGLYSNYLMIINQLNVITKQLFSALTASVGNLLVVEVGEKRYSVFKTLLMLNCWLYTFISISFYFISFPFIEIWMEDRNFLFESDIVLLLSINLFLQGMRLVFSTFKDAAGVFYQDRFVPLLESMVNIVVSIICGLIWGIAGVFIGTISSNLVLYIFSFPKYVYGLILNQGYQKYFRDLLNCLVKFITAFLATYCTLNLLQVANVYLQLVLNTMVCLIIPNLIMLILSYQSKEYKYIEEMILKKLSSFVNIKKKI